MKETFPIIAKTYGGLEPLLADELKEFGIDKVEIKNRAVQFDATIEQIYQLNFKSRLALCFLLKLGEFPVASREDLYNGASKIEWDKFISNRKTIAVDATVFSEVFSHSKFPSLVVKDAIADYFRNKIGKRPDVNLDNPDIMINLHIANNVATLSLNSSGDPLFKRGYKVANPENALNEIIAAAMVRMSKWDGKSQLYDLMCGTGTILIEAAMKALDIPTGLYRQQYCFRNWNNFDEKLWREIRESDNSESHRTKITGFDISEKVLEMATQNLSKANLAARVKLNQGDFFDVYPKYKTGTLIMNPPIADKNKPKFDVAEFYEEVGDRLKRKFGGYTVVILAENNEAIKHIGIKPVESIVIQNGSKEYKIERYEIKSTEEE